MRWQKDDGKIFSYNDDDDDDDGIIIDVSCAILSLLYSNSNGVYAPKIFCTFALYYFRMGKMC